MTTEGILDDPGTIARLDQTGMLGHLRYLPQQVADAWALGSKVDLPPDYRDVDTVVVFGMGGSAIGGDLARTVLEPSLGVPLLVVRDYTCPAFVGPRTLAIAASHSGETEETLSAFRQALDRGAKGLAFTTGGTLLALATERGFPCVQFDHPSQPRAAVGYSLMLPLAVLSGLGLAPELASDVVEAYALLSDLGAELAPEAPADRNLAKQLAEHMAGRVVVACAGALADVGRRWKGQLNENAKHWAHFELMPELCHNAVVAYEDPAGVRQHVAVVMLESDLEHARTAFRFAATGDLLDHYGVSWRRVRARGRSRLAQVLSAICIGDYASYYLALLNGVDPTPIGPIVTLKRRLSSSSL